MKTIACTLCSGNYHYGVAALANSLFRVGYNGVLWVGYQGDIPKWATNLKKVEEYHQFSISDDFKLNFLELPKVMVIQKYKPSLMQKILKAQDQEHVAIAYIDADTIIKAKWEFFERWAELGVGACDDGHFQVGKNHPWRNEWTKVMHSLGYSSREMCNYLCSAFVVVPKSEMKFLKAWEEIINYIVKNKIGSKGDFSSGFFMHDQCEFNAAFMATDCNCSFIGSDGLDYNARGFISSTSIGSVKPWNFSLFKRLYTGVVRPTHAERLYWNNVNGPIKPFSKVVQFYYKLKILIASIIARFYGV